jgi:hypothetical protein
MNQTYQLQTLDLHTLSELLEPLIRRVVREELQHFAEEHPDTFYLAPDSPLYTDLLDIASRREQGSLRLHDHAEVWGE